MVSNHEHVLRKPVSFSPRSTYLWYQVYGKGKFFEDYFEETVDNYGYYTRTLNLGNKISFSKFLRSCKDSSKYAVSRKKMSDGHEHYLVQSQYLKLSIDRTTGKMQLEVQPDIEKRYPESFPLKKMQISKRGMFQLKNLDNVEMHLTEGLELMEQVSEREDKELLEKDVELYRTIGQEILLTLQDAIHGAWVFGPFYLYLIIEDKDIVFVVEAYHKELQNAFIVVPRSHWREGLRKMSEEYYRMADYIATLSMHQTEKATEVFKEYLSSEKLTNLAGAAIWGHHSSSNSYADELASILTGKPRSINTYKWRHDKLLTAALRSNEELKTECDKMGKDKVTAIIREKCLYLYFPAFNAIYLNTSDSRILYLDPDDEVLKMIPSIKTIRSETSQKNKGLNLNELVEIEKFIENKYVESKRVMMLKKSYPLHNRYVEACRYIAEGFGKLLKNPPFYIENTLEKSYRLYFHIPTDGSIGFEISVPDLVNYRFQDAGNCGVFSLDTLEKDFSNWLALWKIRELKEYKNAINHYKQLHEQYSKKY